MFTLLMFNILSRNYLVTLFKCPDRIAWLLRQTMSSSLQLAQASQSASLSALFEVKFFYSGTKLRINKALFML